MQPRSSLVDVLTNGETALGTVLSTVSPNAAEALGYTPLDFLFLDGQHGSPLSARLEHLVRASDLNDMPVVVRVPREDTSTITSFLDAGARGIMLPQVEDVETVQEASSHVRYRDGRSMGSSTRSARFGYVPKPQYGDYVNEDIALVPMVETEGGVNAAAELARLDETTALAIGPGDLANSLGVDFGSDAHRSVIDQVFEVGDEADCLVGLFVGSRVEVERYRTRAAFLIYRSDVGVLVDHYERVLGGDETGN